MNREETIRFFIKEGFVEYPGSFEVKGSCCLAKTRAIKGPDCDCNDRKPQLVVIISPDYIDGRSVPLKPTVDFKICAEKDELWLVSKVYNIKLEEASEKYEEIKNRLTKVWNAFCK